MLCLLAMVASGLTSVAEDQNPTPDTWPGEEAFATLDEKTGKMGFKLRLLMGVHPKYGAHAKSYLPRLKKMAPGWAI